MKESISIPLESIIKAVATVKPDDGSTEEMLSIKEVCKLLKISRYTVRRLIIAGHLVATKMGKANGSRVLVYASSVQSFLKANIISPKSKDNE